MFPFVFREKTTEHREEEHQEFPEIMGPFFTRTMCMSMYFHDWLNNYKLPFTSFTLINS
jgi:hypothetical protein